VGVKLGWTIIGRYVGESALIKDERALSQELFNLRRSGIVGKS
jgi:hypothetical protein